MNFDFSSLMAGFTFGVFGFYLLKYGRKEVHPWHIAIGIVLMIYPYFLEGPILTWGVGVALITLAYVMR